MTLNPVDRALAGRVRRELRRAGRPLGSYDLARRLGRRWTQGFREFLALLWVRGRIAHTDAGFVLAGRRAALAPARVLRHAAPD